MELKSELAQSIVDKMMQKIPYNINMMNKHGYIIASGDKSRINTLHVGALDAIKQKKTLTMSNTHGNHGMPGVNMPVYFNNKIIGVVGITGDPDKVLPLASLLEVSTELLLNQSQLEKFEKKQQERLNRFIYQWIQVKDSISTLHTNLLIEAKQLGINLTIKRYVIAIHSVQKSLPFIYQDPEDYSLSLSNNTILILTQKLSTLERVKKFCNSNSISIGISDPTTLIGIGVEQALKTVELSLIFDVPDYIKYSDVSFLNCLLSSNFHINDIVTKFTQLKKKILEMN